MRKSSVDDPKCFGVGEVYEKKCKIYTANFGPDLDKGVAIDPKSLTLNRPKYLE